MREPTWACRECKAQTYYKNDDGTPSETCQNCTFFLKTFWATVAALNEYQPLTGRRRQIKILEYKMEIA